jgi:hypothetical protein
MLLLHWPNGCALMNSGLGRSANARFSDSGSRTVAGRLQRRPYQAGHEYPPGTATLDCSPEREAAICHMSAAQRAMALAMMARNHPQEMDHQDYGECIGEKGED